MKGEVNIIYNIINISIQLKECRKTTKSFKFFFMPYLKLYWLSCLTSDFSHTKSRETAQNDVYNYNGHLNSVTFLFYLIFFYIKHEGKKSS